MSMEHLLSGFNLSKTPSIRNYYH